MVQKTVFICLSIFILVACGQTGPLYLPDGQKKSPLISPTQEQNR